MWTIFKIIIEFVIILLLLFFIKFWLFDQDLRKVLWDHSSLTRDQTCTSCVGSQSPNHWLTREVPKGYSPER